MPTAIRALLAPAAALRRLARVLDTLAAGMLSRAELRAGIAADWDDFRQEPEEVLRGLFEWEDAVLAQAVEPSDRILAVGAGTGRELIALAARGHVVVGVEPSGRSVAVARALLAQRGLDATVVQGFFEDADCAGRYDVVMFCHRTYGLIPGSSFRVDALRKAASLLHDRGRIIVSYLRGQGMHGALVRAARLGAAISRSDLRVEPGDEIYRRGQSGALFGFEHHFSPDEFLREVHGAGLHVYRSWEGSCPVVVLTPTATSVPSNIHPAITVASNATCG